jgi:hypothetical protein
MKLTDFRPGAQSIMADLSHATIGLLVTGSRLARRFFPIGAARD